ncbi:MAG: DUF2807 domain-containing protein [Flavobacteriales bacterium]|nr:DUF2807 domain-containing protein [Flavobacteriales bacterium]
MTSTGPERLENAAWALFYSDASRRNRIDLVLENRESGTLVVEGGANLLDQVVTEVEAGTLTVRNENRQLGAASDRASPCACRWRR